MAYLNGESGSIIFASQTLAVKNWEANFECDILDTTTSANNGFPVNIRGQRNATGNFETNWDGTSPYTGSTFAFEPGLAGTLVCNIGNSGKSFTIPIRVKNFKVKNVVNEVITFSLEWQSNGQWTFPS